MYTITIIIIYNNTLYIYIYIFYSFIYVCINEAWCINCSANWSRVERFYISTSTYNILNDIILQKTQERLSFNFPNSPCTTFISEESPSSHKAHSQSILRHRVLPQRCRHVFNSTSSFNRRDQSGLWVWHTMKKKKMFWHKYRKIKET